MSGNEKLRMYADILSDEQATAAVALIDGYLNTQDDASIRALPYTICQLQEIISPIARQHGAKRVAVFGSYGRGEATDKSDVDLYVERGEMRSLLRLSAFLTDLEKALKLPVDLVTDGTNDQAFLDRIQVDEVVLYEQ